jgi:hypothetical protein
MEIRSRCIPSSFNRCIGKANSCRHRIVKPMATKNRSKFTQGKKTSLIGTAYQFGVCKRNVNDNPWVITPTKDCHNLAMSLMRKFPALRIQTCLDLMEFNFTCMWTCSTINLILVHVPSHTGSPKTAERPKIIGSSNSYCMSSVLRSCITKLACNPKIKTRA